MRAGGSAPAIAILAVRTAGTAPASGAASDGGAAAADRAMGFAGGEAALRGRFTGATWSAPDGGLSAGFGDDDRRGT
jgi:hypothetical protein